MDFEKGVGDENMFLKPVVLVLIMSDEHLKISSDDKILMEDIGVPNKSVSFKIPAIYVLRSGAVCKVSSANA